VLLPARKALAVALVAGTFSSVLAGEAGAATADVFANGREYCASTHPNHGTIAGFGAAVDLNGKPDDYLWPLFAPGEGRVHIYSNSSGGFGKSIIWTSADGLERIHLAHLASFGHTGRVRAGAIIARLGSTGVSTGPHLHAAASVEGMPADVVLGGEVIEPGRCYTSRGPIPPECLGRDATVIGTARRDRLVGTPADDVFVAKAGRDLVNGRGGDDAICGGPGADALDGGQGMDHSSGGGADDSLRGGPGRDRLGGEAGADRLAAGPGADRLLDDVGSDRLSGGTGGDALAGGRGEDVLLGDEGGDRLEGNEGGDRLAGGIGNDGLAGGAGEDDAVYSAAAARVVASLGLERARGQGRDRLAGIEGLVGSPYDDVLTGAAGGNRLLAGAGADRVDGGEGADLVDGGTGSDTLIGGLGVDLVSYGRSSQPVQASLEQRLAATADASDVLEGFESLQGSQRADTLTGDGGDNAIYGEGGADALDGRGGINRLDGGDGFDTCLNGTASQRCEG